MCVLFTTIFCVFSSSYLVTTSWVPQFGTETIISFTVIGYFSYTMYVRWQFDAITMKRVTSDWNSSIYIQYLLLNEHFSFLKMYFWSYGIFISINISVHYFVSIRSSHLRKTSQNFKFVSLTRSNANCWCVATKTFRVTHIRRRAFSQI